LKWLLRTNWSLGEPILQAHKATKVAGWQLATS